MSFATTSLHPLDILEHADSYLVLVDVPGTPRESLDIEVIENELKISRVEPQTDESAPKRQVLRALQLGKEVDPESVQAKLDAGVLEIRLDKKKASPARNVIIH